jgi:hypothetical protein
MSYLANILRLGIGVAGAALALPAAHAANDSAILQCAQAYAAENFPGSVVTVQVDDFSSLPAVAATGTQIVQLEATDGAGRSLGKAVCEVKDQPAGRITILPADE